MRWNRAFIVAGLLGALVACGKSGPPAGGKLRLATTTSVKDSGLLGVLLPAFEKKTGYTVEVSAVGSGQALELLAGGKADVAITHSPGDEKAALEAGRVAARTPFMHNGFVIVGPPDATATIAGATGAREVMKRIAASGRPFISRGDGSGTNARERQLWAAAEIDPASSFIVSAKAGMGATLAQASKDKAFALSDRGTFLAKRKDLDLVIVFDGDPALLNVYALIEPREKAEGARALRDFVRSPEGRTLIGGFGVKELGEPLFTPDE